MRVPRRSHRTHDRILRADPSSLLFSIVHRNRRLNDVNDPFHFSNCRPFFYIFKHLGQDVVVVGHSFLLWHRLQKQTLDTT
jgi:hypothetical protein